MINLKLRLLIAITVSLISSCVPAMSATYYVRCDGGTASQCDGTHDSPVTGAVDGADAGSVPDCAFNSPNWASGANVNAGGAAAAMAGGDTLIIDGVLEPGCIATNSGRAEYVLGFNAPNMPAGPLCAQPYPYGCIPNTFPAGSSVGFPTKIYGKGRESCKNPPQLWGDQAMGRNDGDGGVLNINSNTDVDCVEITDHSGCVSNHRGGGNIDNSGSQDPIACSTNYATNPGRWAGKGLRIANSAHDINLSNMWIHGMAYHTIYGNSQTGNITHTNVFLKGNGFDEYTGADNADLTGNYFWNGGGLYFSGCGERYPPTVNPVSKSRSELRSPTDIHDCWSQDQGGYGDAYGRSAKSGNWTIDGADGFGNVSDLWDFLYDSAGTAKFTHNKCEANAGACFKSGMTNSYIENSMLIGNCVWWVNNPAVFGSSAATGRSGSTCNHNGTCDANENFDNCSDCTTFNYCRPAQQTVLGFAPRAGFILKIIGNTITGNGDTLIGLAQRNGTCNGTETMVFKNNIAVGGTEYNGGESDRSVWLYNDQSTCSAPVQDYNFIAGTKTWATDCSGQANSHCYATVSSLNLVGPIDNDTPGYLQGTDYMSAYFLQVTSPAHGASSADETVSLIGTSNDVTGFNRRTTWDSGSYEYRPVQHFATDYYNVSQ